jgi:acyl carrier protein phosphodiesterase
MAELSNQIDYLDYIARYKSRDNPSQWTWTELEARFKQLVAKYEVRWPDIPIKLKKYSAIYRLIETYCKSFIP